MRFPALFSLALPVFSATGQAESIPPSAKAALLSTASALSSERGEQMDSLQGDSPDVSISHRQARIESLFLALERALAPVTDKVSADAAAPAVLQLSDDLRQVREESHRISARVPEAEKSMDDWNLQQGKAFALLTEKSFRKALDLLLDSPSCHGSPALEGALLQLFDVLEEREPEDESAT